jgi:tetratricopeptide (TPR) repeat protein
MSDQALTMYKDAHKHKPNWQLPLKRIAAIYFRQGRVEDSIEQYRKLESVDQDNITTKLINGYLQIAAGSYRDAKHILEKAIISGPQQQVQDDINQQRLLQQGEFQKVIDNITNQLKETPSQPELFYKRAQIYNNLQQTEAAVQDYKSSLQICPYYIEAAIQLAGIYSQAGKFIESARLYYKALAINTQYIELYIALSRANLELDGKKNARETLSLAGSLVPNNSILLKAAIKSHFLAYESLNHNEGQPEANFQQFFPVFLNKLANDLQSSDSDPFTAYLLFLLNDSDKGDSKDFNKQLHRIIKRSGFAPACDLLAAELCEKGSYSAAFKLLPSGNLPSGKALGKYYQTAVLYSNNRLYTAAREQLKSRLNNAVPSEAIDKYLSLAIFNLGMISLDSILYRTADAAIEKTEQTIHSQ